MNNHLRKQVLNTFKSLHRTRQLIFDGDIIALEKGRQRINEEYKNKKNVTDEKVIQELLNFSNQVEKELRTRVVQAKETEPGKYALRINEHTLKLDSVPYKECSSN